MFDWRYGIIPSPIPIISLSIMKMVNHLGWFITSKTLLSLFSFAKWISNFICYDYRLITNANSTIYHSIYQRHSDIFIRQLVFPPSIICEIKDSSITLDFAVHFLRNASSSAPSTGRNQTVKTAPSTLHWRKLHSLDMYWCSQKYISWSPTGFLLF